MGESYFAARQIPSTKLTVGMAGSGLQSGDLLRIFCLI
jgi:hypothetical protein